MTERIGIPDTALEDPIACANYFNNWHSNLPGGDRREYYYEDMLDAANTDSKHREGKTVREFWGAIDQALTDCEIDHQVVSSKVIELNRMLSQRTDYIRKYLEVPGPSTEVDALLLDLHRLTAPAFTRLKQQGFTHEDLTA